jgi:hypothetical protein
MQSVLNTTKTVTSSPLPGEQQKFSYIMVVRVGVDETGGHFQQKFSYIMVVRVGVDETEENKDLLTNH